MKAVSRSKFWWPGLDRAIESQAAVCRECVQAMPMQSAKEPVNWPETKENWSRMHIDYAGPIKGKMVLIVVDSHSKWIKAVPLSHATTQSTIAALRMLFSRFGIPRTLVSDNGTQFTSQEFKTFVTMNNISHLRTAPFHPQSNGLAERAVRTVKDGIKKMRGENLETNLVRMLFNYRRTPQTSGRSPSEVLLGYQIRSRIDTCFPSVARDATNDDPGWNFAPGDPVYFRNYGDGDNWTPGQVKSTSGSRMLTVSTPSKVVHRHADQVRRRIPEEDHLLDQQAGTRPPTASSSSAITNDESHHPDAPTAIPVELQEEATLRRSSRTRKPVDRFHF